MTDIVLQFSKAEEETFGKDLSTAYFGVHERVKDAGDIPLEHREIYCSNGAMPD